MKRVGHRIAWPGRGAHGWENLLAREWLVTNGLGGYASGTVCGVPTRRFHGLLVSALPAPLGRTTMLNHLVETASPRDGQRVFLSGEERGTRPDSLPGGDVLAEFRLEWGHPVWVYDLGDCALEKRLFMVHRQNTVHLSYRLLRASRPVRLRLSPALHFRPHEAPLGKPRTEPYVLRVSGPRYEIDSDEDYPPLRLVVDGPPASFVSQPASLPEVVYHIERRRGYDYQGGLWIPGYFRVNLEPGQAVTLVASTEEWDTVQALSPEQARELEADRVMGLLADSQAPDEDTVAAQLTLAADQFLIAPTGRTEDTARARAAGDDVRTVIAGYHWFTDWGRDTMISLEGLTLVTGRRNEARWILRTFAHYVRDGLIPNMFPEGEREGLYHTADATLWYFHALARYLAFTDERATLRLLLPILLEVVQHHLRGTHFGIRVDPADGLLHQGEEGYQLTWMDAKVDGWVVTPRRGKAVEINALWYNALRLLESWLRQERREDEAGPLREHAERAYASFNRRFWYEEGGYLYDVVDGQGGDDTACRPNQLLAFSLTHPILDPTRWKPVLEVVEERLLTPVGLRSLAPGHPDYKPMYYGDLRSRDAAYHQGTIWGWLIGPFIDAWLRVHPGREREAHAFLQGFVPHLEEACVGSISEIFDAEAPFTPRGCVAQAWSVAEVLRCWLRTGSDSSTRAGEEAAHEAAGFSPTQTTR